MYSVPDRAVPNPVHIPSNSHCLPHLLPHRKCTVSIKLILFSKSKLIYAYIFAKKARDLDPDHPVYISRVLFRLDLVDQEIRHFLNEY